MQTQEHAYRAEHVVEFLQMVMRKITGIDKNGGQVLPMGISDQNTLHSLQAQAEAEGRQCVVGALIRNAQGHLLVQKRAPNRKLYPDCWDIIGGHVEVGESLT